MHARWRRHFLGRSPAPFVCARQRSLRALCKSISFVSVRISRSSYRLKRAPFTFFLIANHARSRSKLKPARSRSHRGPLGALHRGAQRPSGHRSVQHRNVPRARSRRPRGDEERRRRRVRPSSPFTTPGKLHRVPNRPSRLVEGDPRGASSARAQPPLDALGVLPHRRRLRANPRQTLVESTHSLRITTDASSDRPNARSIVPRRRRRRRLFARRPTPLRPVRVQRVQRREVLLPPPRHRVPKNRNQRIKIKSDGVYSPRRSFSVVVVTPANGN